MSDGEQGKGKKREEGKYTLERRARFKSGRKERRRERKAQRKMVKIKYKRVIKKKKRMNKERMG